MLKQDKAKLKELQSKTNHSPGLQRIQAKPIFHNIKASGNFYEGAIRDVDRLLYIEVESFCCLGASHRRLLATPGLHNSGGVASMSVSALPTGIALGIGAVQCLEDCQLSFCFFKLKFSFDPKQFSRRGSRKMSRLLDRESHFALRRYFYSPGCPSSSHREPMTTVQIDPLNSPYPVPWNWIMAVLTEAKADATPRFRYYRSPSLISPDGEFAAYSRIQVELATHLTQSRVASVLFLENLKTGDLHTIAASSPFADNPFMTDADPDEAGRIAILIPVGWSESGDRVLAREFESIFGSDIASDFAVVWHRSSNLTRTIAPTQVDYSNAVLLGWSQTDPNQVLFRAGNLGDTEWSLYAVDANGQTHPMTQDQPIVFGQTVNSIWAGPQASVRP